MHAGYRPPHKGKWWDDSQLGGLQRLSAVPYPIEAQRSGVEFRPSATNNPRPQRRGNSILPQVRPTLCMSAALYLEGRRSPNIGGKAPKTRLGISDEKCNCLIWPKATLQVQLNPNDHPFDQTIVLPLASQAYIVGLLCLVSFDLNTQSQAPSFPVSIAEFIPPVSAGHRHPSQHAPCLHSAAMAFLVTAVGYVEVEWPALACLTVMFIRRLLLASMLEARVVRTVVPLRWRTLRLIDSLHIAK